MADQRLFLLEFLITKIKIKPGTITIPVYEDIQILLRCSHFLFADIITEEFPIEELQPGLKPADGVFNVKIGKSYLFPFKPLDLERELGNNSLLIEMVVAHESVGSTDFQWTQDFVDLATTFDTTGLLKNVISVQSLELVDSTKQSVCTIDMSIKLSCLGERLETYFTVKNEEEIFMNPTTNTQFKCEKFGGFEFTPEMFEGGKLPMVSGSKVSWMELFEGKMAADMISVAPMIPLDDIGFQMFQTQKSYADTISGWDLISIVFRPAENKFFDLLNLLAEQPDALSKAEKPHGMFDGDDDDELASEKINKMLCKNPACPAARKFKDYGLGPLATGPGLGTLYKSVEPRKTYRLSNTYGVFTKYGPYGVFAKSEYPFFPPKDESDTEACPDAFPCPGDEYPQPTDQNVCDCCGRVCRLRGGEEQRQKKCRCKRRVHHKKEKSEAPLRLRGGGILDFEGPTKVASTPYYTSSYEFDQIYSYNFSSTTTYYESQPFSFRLRGGGIHNEDKPGVLKSALVECKSVMDQFDNILLAYRKALGPCGEATCPFSQNIVEKSCQRVCQEPPDPCPCQRTESCEDTPCQIPTCPYKEKPALKFGAGCGSPKCPYAQYKLGLVDADAELELAFLPPPIQGKCGDPKCDYPPQYIKLPPIHWDCPDPLPQGVCKNPNCPHQPADLKEIKIPVPKSPCLSPKCPYALPNPCDLPSCPFRQKPCPFRDQKKSGKKPGCGMESSSSSESSSEPASECCNPDCPYKAKPKPKPDKSGGCNNPKCPYGQVQNPKKKKKQQACCCNGGSESDDSMCDSPECPLNRNKRNVSARDDTCANPGCPSKVQDQDDESSDMCDNPECPFRKKKRHSKEREVEPCDNPKCPFKAAGGDDDIECTNPECPFKDGGGSSGDSGSICSSPECPALQQRKQKRKDSDDSLCDNPECPFRKQTGGGDYGEAVCDGCDDSVCSNPECPNYGGGGGQKTEYCDNPTCPFSKEYQTSICVDPFCPYAQPLPSCGIPNCPYEKKPLLFCPSPICPSKFPPTNQKRSSPPQIKSEFKEQKRRSETGDANESNKKSGDAVPDSGTQTAEYTPEKKIKSRFVYSFGDTYPGIKIGHKECLTPRFRIPPRMGWLWNKQSPYFGCKKRRGWRPGAIEKSIAAIIKAHREAKGLGLLMVPQFGSGSKRRRGDESDDDINIHPKPTLHITKKDGAFLITMNPLKDPYSLADNEDPYMECTPMQFKITKNKPQKAGDDAVCHCDDNGDDSDTDDSELDIEFTPPAGIIHPDRFKKKRNLIHCESQYNPADFAEKSKKKKENDKEKKGGKGTGKKGGKGEKKGAKKRG